MFSPIMKRLLVLLALVASLTCPTLHAGFLFLQIDGVDGDSREVGFVKQITVESFQLDFQTKGTFRFAFNKSLDVATVPLMLNGASGKPMKRAVLRFAERTETALREIYTITLEDVTIESVGSSGSSNGLSVRESYSLKYGIVRWDYRVFTADGRLSNTISAAFNVAEGRPL